MCTEKIIFMAGNTHEYVAKAGNCDLFCCRAPHGARGLKRLGAELLARLRVSRPARGAWIETYSASDSDTPTQVAPRTGRVD